MKDLLRPDIASLLGSRICHDLISPLGAIGNGLELIELSGDPDGPEMELIRDSVQNATARIRMFRLAFGTSDPEQMISGNEIRDILTGMHQGSRIQVVCDLPTTLSRDHAKLLTLLALCIESALPVGGVLTLAANATEHMAQATGPKIVFNDPLWTVVQSQTYDDTLRAGDVHFALAAETASRMGCNVTVKADDTSLAVRF